MLTRVSKSARCNQNFNIENKRKVKGKQPLVTHIYIHYTHTIYTITIIFPYLKGYTKHNIIYKTLIKEL